MKTNTPAIVITAAQEEKAGAEIALALDLERDEKHPDRWVTGWGTKTNLGLFRTIKEQILQAEGKAPGSPDPAITLKAENEKLRQALEKLSVWLIAPDTSEQTLTKMHNVCLAALGKEIP